MTTLVYKIAEGVIFLDNPVALMFAANHGLPGCLGADTIAEDDMLRRAIVLGVDIVLDTDGDETYLAAAREVLS